MITLLAFLGSLLLGAGLMKLRNPQALESALVQGLPPQFWRGPLQSRSTARLLIFSEIATGAVLLTATPAIVPFASGAAATLFVLFSAFIVAQYRRQRPCSCFGEGGAVVSKHRAALGIGLALAALVVFVAALQGGQVAAMQAGTLPELGLGIVAGFTYLGIATIQRRAATAPAVHRREIADGEASTRRGFLGRVAAATASLVVFNSLTLTQDASANPPRSCQAQFDLCYGCNPAQVSCCIGCYTSCQLIVGGCPGGACGGCWPGP